MSDTVILEKADRVATITLNRPDKLNAFNDAMLEDMSRVLDEVERETELWVVVFKGAGPCFSVGQDLSEEGTSAVMPPDPRERWFLSELFEAEWKRKAWFERIFNLHRFTIAQVHGHCLSWGLDLAMCCKAAVATEDAILGDASIRTGYSTRSPFWTWKVGPRKAKELLYTGKYISGTEAQQIGLVSVAVPEGELEDMVRHAGEAFILGTPIGGFDQESFNMAFGRADWDISGLAAAWDYTTNLYALGAIQRRGFAPGEFDWWEVTDQKGWKAALAERDRPYRELGF